MIQYVIFTHTKTSNELPEKKSFFGSPEHYSNDAMIHATDCRIEGTVNADNEKFNSLAEAKNSLIGSKVTPPIYVIEYSDSCAKILSATHGTLAYDLSTTWQQKQELFKEINAIELKQNLYIEKNNALTEKIFTFKSNIWSVEGKLPYEELIKICKATNELLEEPTPKKIEQYKKLAEKQKNHSPLIQALYLSMLAIAAVFATLAATMLMTPAAPVTAAACTATKSLIYGALGVFGLFVDNEKSKAGLCTAMNDIVADTKSTIPTL